MSQHRHARGRQPARPARRAFARRAGRGQFEDQAKGAFGYAHSYETSSRYDGPGLRVGAVRVGLPAALHLLPQSRYLAPEGRDLHLGPAGASIGSADFAPALRALDGGLTISGGEPMVQLAFTRRILAGAKQMGLHTAIETSGFLGDRVDDDYLSILDLVLLDIKSSDPETYRAVTERRSRPHPAVRRAAGRHRQAGLGPVHAGAGLDRRSRQCRGHRPLRRADEECRMGRGPALPSARRVQVEGDEARLQTRQHADADAGSHQARARAVPRRRLQRALIRQRTIATR